MPNTFTLIASSTAGSGGVPNFDFTSIPSTYTDLCLKTSLRSTASGGGGGAAWDNVRIRVNGTSGSSRALYTFDNATPESSNFTAEIYYWIDYSGATANTFASADTYITNYASSNSKSFSIDSVTENNSINVALSLSAGIWSNSTAINQLTVTPTSGNFAQFSTAYLYGIVKS